MQLRLLHYAGSRLRSPHCARVFCTPVRPHAGIRLVDTRPNVRPPVDLGACVCPAGPVEPVGLLLRCCLALADRDSPASQAAGASLSAGVDAAPGSIVTPVRCRCSVLACVFSLLHRFFPALLARLFVISFVTAIIKYTHAHRHTMTHIYTHARTHIHINANYPL